MNISLAQAAQNIAEAMTENPVLTPVVSAESEMDLWDMAMKGGWIMIVLAVLFILCCYIFFERWTIIRSAEKEDPLFMERMRDYIQNGELKSAINYCRINNTPVAHMVEKGIIRIGCPAADVQAAIENAGSIEIGRLRRRLPVIATIAVGAPMTGFLGTAVGMVTVFWDMANAGNNIDIALLASGIYEATITTVGGLIVGIPSLFAYSYLVAKVDTVVNQLKTKTLAFMDLLNEEHRKD